VRWRWLVGGESRLMSEYQINVATTRSCIVCASVTVSLLVWQLEQDTFASSPPQPSRRDDCSHPQPKVPQCESLTTNAGQQTYPKDVDPPKGTSSRSSKGSRSIHPRQLCRVEQKNKHSARFEASRNAASRHQARQGQARTSQL
jgi:hypothetical protein